MDAHLVVCECICEYTQANECGKQHIKRYQAWNFALIYHWQCSRRWFGLS